MGPATVLSIGTANPPNCIDQKIFPLTEEILKNNPNFCKYKSPSFNARQEIAIVEVPKLGKEAAQKAINEWCQSKSKITHLVFCTTSGADIPGADYQLTKLLGLDPSVKRFMMYQQGCAAGGAALRLAKDLAENNKGARVLVVCSEISLFCFHAPSETETVVLIGQALFSDGASAVIVGSDPILTVERPLFQLAFVTQTLLPDSGHAIIGNLNEAGLIAKIHKDTPMLISKNVERILEEVFQPLGVSDWNSIFWVSHAGGREILDQIEIKLHLNPKKLKATRDVMRDYGNMGSVNVFFVLKEMRKASIKAELGTTCEGLEWGVLFGFGPGLTIEAVVLHSVSV
ncbi:unnamed protein product [Withania somnifera]